MTMDPIPPSLSSLTAVAQALLLRQGLQPADVEALLKAVGQELSVLFLGQSLEGAKLELPSGRIVTAQGELPFPEGTQLRVRVETEAGALKLQTLEAKPPGAPALLAPLLQGEAASLAARLQQSTPAPELAPLVNLLRSLGGLPQPSPLPGLPTTQALAAAIAALPKDHAESLARVLGAAPGAEPLEVAQRLSKVLEAEPELPGRSVGSTRTVDQKQVSAAAEGLARFQGMLQRSEVPVEHRSALDGWIRSLLARKAPEPTNPSPSPPELAAPARKAVRSESPILTTAETARMEAALKVRPGAPAQVPEVWENWVKGSVRALSDPALSPREAPFHALQAKEGTAYFEIPLPWASGKPLQLWVEADAPESSTPDPEPTTRVLLGLQLSRLGETRVGLQSRRGSLSVRIWTEHPELVESQRDAIERELRESGKAVDLRILPLEPGSDGNIPDLRSLAMGPSLHAMG